MKNKKDNIKKITSLPFISKMENGEIIKWKLPSKNNDYDKACKIGSNYARSFIQFIIENPFYAGSNLLGSIVEDIKFDDYSPNRGYNVGFFSTIEEALYFNYIELKNIYK